MLPQQPCFPHLSLLPPPLSAPHAFIDLPPSPQIHPNELWTASNRNGGGLPLQGFKEDEQEDDYDDDDEEASYDFKTTVYVPLKERDGYTQAARPTVAASEIWLLDHAEKILPELLKEAQEGCKLSWSNDDFMLNTDAGVVKPSNYLDFMQAVFNKASLKPSDDTTCRVVLDAGKISQTCRPFVASPLSNAVPNKCPTTTTIGSGDGSLSRFWRAFGFHYMGIEVTKLSHMFAHNTFTKEEAGQPSATFFRGNIFDMDPDTPLEVDVVYTYISTMTAAPALFLHILRLVLVSSRVKLLVFHSRESQDCSPLQLIWFCVDKAIKDCKFADIRGVLTEQECFEGLLQLKLTVQAFLAPNATYSPDTDRWHCASQREYMYAWFINQDARDRIDGRRLVIVPLPSPISPISVSLISF